MSTLAEMVVRIGADASRLKRGLQSASQDVNRFTRHTEATGRAMQSMGRSSLRAGLYTAGGMALVIRTGMKFDKTMSTVRAATGATEKDFQTLRKAALKWGADSQFSATQVAEAMVEMGKAGFNTQQTLKSLPGVLSAAAASGESMATVSNIMVNTLTAYGKSASYATHVSDALAYSANATTASIGDFGEALKYVGPVAKSAGVSFDETNGALIALAKVGIQGSMAGTSLRGVLQSMIAPNKRVTQAMKDAGLSFRDANGNMAPLSTNIDRLRSVLSTMSKSDADKFLARMFGRENIAAAQAFLDIGGKGLENFTAQSKKSKGSAEKFANTLRDNLNGDLENLGGAAETAATKMSDDLTPNLRNAAREAKALVDAFNELDPNTRKAVTNFIAASAIFMTFAGVVGVVGGAVVRGVGIMAKAFTPLVMVLKFIGPKLNYAFFAIRYFVVASGGLLGAFGRIAGMVFKPIGVLLRVVGGTFAWLARGIAMAVTAIAAVLGAPVWLVAAIVVAVAAAAAAIIIWWDKIKTGTASAWDWITSKISQAKDMIVDAVRATGDGVGAAWEYLKSLTIQKVAYAFGYILGYIAGTLVRLVVMAAVGIGKLAVALAHGAEDAVKAVIKFFKDLPQKVWDVLQALWSTAKSGMDKFASNVSDGASKAAKWFKDAVSNLPETASDIFHSVYTHVKKWVQKAPEVVWENMQKLPDKISSILDACINAAKDLGRAIVQGIVSGVKAAAGALKDAAVGVVEGALDGAKKALHIKSPSRRAAKELGIPFSHGIAMGIWQGSAAAADAARAVAENAMDAAEKTAGKADNKRALRMINHAKQLQAIAARMIAKMDRLTMKGSLAQAYYQLQVDLAGGIPTLAMQKKRISELQTEYNKLAAYMKKFGKKLSADQRLSILQTLDGYLQEINQIRSDIADAAATTTTPIGGGETGGLGSTVIDNTSTTDTLDSSGGTSSVDGLTVTAGSSRVGSRPIIQQNFIGPNVDHFTAARQAMFSYETAGLAPA